MASHKQHELFGIVLWIIFLVYLILTYMTSLAPQRLVYIGLIAFVFCFVGASMPDIDQKNSVAFRRIRFLLGVITFVVSFVMLAPRFTHDPIGIGYLLGVCALITAVIIILLYALMPYHRGPIHSLKTAVIYGVICLIITYVLLFNIWLSMVIAFFALLSFISHLLVDKL
jgi:hypothetical protein